MQCVGPPVCGHALALTNQPPTALWVKPFEAKAKGWKTLTENLEWSPIRHPGSVSLHWDGNSCSLVITGRTDYSFPRILMMTTERASLVPGKPEMPTFCPGCALERTLQEAPDTGLETTRGVAVYGL